MVRQMLRDLPMFAVCATLVVVACLRGGWSWWATVLAVAGFLAVCYLLTHPMRAALVEQRRGHEERMRMWRDFHRGSG